MTGRGLPNKEKPWQGEAGGGGNEPGEGGGLGRALISHCPSKWKERRNEKRKTHTHTLRGVTTWAMHLFWGRKKKEVTLCPYWRWARMKRRTGWTERTVKKKRGPAGYFWVVEESAKLPVQTRTCPKGKPGCIHPTELFSPASTYPEQTSTGGPTASPGATFRSLELEKGKSPSHLLKKEQENPYCIIGEGCICPKKYCKWR